VRRSLEDILLAERLLDEAALRVVRRAARRSGMCLAHAAVHEGRVDEERLAGALAQHLGCTRARPAELTIDEEAVREVPHDLAEAHRLLAFGIDRGESRRAIRVAMADPLDRDAIEEIEMSTGCVVEPVLITLSEAADLVQRHYRGVITKMIPRAEAGSAARPPDPPTVPHLKLPDEAPYEARLRVLVDLLVERGLLDREAYDEAIRRLVRGDV
jgi:hypothetical protein